MIEAMRSATVIENIIQRMESIKAVLERMESHASFVLGPQSQISKESLYCVQALGVDVARLDRVRKWLVETCNNMRKMITLEGEQR